MVYYQVYNEKHKLVKEGRCEFNMVNLQKNSKTDKVYFSLNSLEGKTIKNNEIVDIPKKPFTENGYWDGTEWCKYNYELEE